MLRIAESWPDESWRAVSKQTLAIVFIATPHTGSSLANCINTAGKPLRLSVSVRELEDNSPQLRELNFCYRDYAKRLGVQTRTFFETQNTYGIRVVDETSSDPGVDGSIPVPAAGDHLTICKPKARDGIYDSIVGFIREVLRATAARPGLSDGMVVDPQATALTWEMSDSTVASPPASAPTLAPPQSVGATPPATAPAPEPSRGTAVVNRYCQRCGAKTGLSSECVPPYGTHDFVKGGAHDYCNRCGAGTGLGSQCLPPYGTHDFVRGYTDVYVYCSRCGAKTGLISECVPPYGTHDFVKGDAHDYCNRCGAGTGLGSQCVRPYGTHDFVRES